MVFGQIVTQSAPKTVAAEQYHSVVDSLNLAMEARARDESRNPLAPLVAAAAALKAAGTLGASSRRAAALPPAKPVPKPIAHVPVKPAEDDGAQDLWEEGDETEAPSLHITPPTAPTRLLSAAEIPVLPSDLDPICQAVCRLSRCQTSVPANLGGPGSEGAALRPPLPPQSQRPGLRIRLPTTSA